MTDCLSVLFSASVSVLFSASVSVLFSACGADTSSGGEVVDESPKQVVVPVESGINFKDESPGNSFESDLFVTKNSSEGPKAATGGANSTKNEPANWFLQGGVPRQFQSFEQVPLSMPTDGDGGIMLHVKTGYGFVIRNFISGGHTVGWISEATETQLTIEYKVVD